MAGGAQESMAQQKGRALWQARDELEKAKRAPFQGSSSTATITNAQRRLNEATTAFDKAYTLYVQSMSRAGQTPKPNSDFIIR